MKPIHCLCACPRPFRDALVILWPYPWKFSSPPLVPVQTLLDNPDYITSRKITEVNYTMLHHLTLFCLRDTPLCCLYRLYESTVTGDEEAMMEESQYWFHRQPGWRLADILDPRDPDPIRYAILASLTDALVLSFNHKIQMGLRRGITIDKPWLIAGFSNDPNPPFEHTPTWCQSLGRLSEKLVLYPGTVICDNLEVLPGPILTSNLGPFIKRNIVANFAQLYNV